MNNYVIDKVPNTNLGVESKGDYGKVWYCHMKGHPNIPVWGSVGTKRHAQAVCNFYNGKLNKKRRSGNE